MSNMFKCPNCGAESPIEELTEFVIYCEKSVQCNECGCIEPLEED